ncbi:putative quinol monooxygenase [Streptomyces sp. NPDC020192]|uniref:putative quinol monooxygenase n=1 Tax=Streptomyces sp. NPDC020192 TaxID=3365066 RepID=UPI0037A6E532
MFSRVVSVRIKPDVREDFLSAITTNAEASVRDEPGCIRFDLCDDREDENLFFLYEVYADAEAAEAHRSTPHFLAWRQAADRYVEPGSQVNHSADLLVSAC